MARQRREKPIEDVRSILASKLKGGTLSRSEAERLADALVACNLGKPPALFTPSAAEARRRYSRETSDDLYLIRWCAVQHVYGLQGPPHNLREKEAVFNVATALGISVPTIRDWRRECKCRDRDVVAIWKELRTYGGSLIQVDMKRLAADYKRVKAAPQRK